MVSHPEFGSDLPIGSNQESWCDRNSGLSGPEGAVIIIRDNDHLIKARRRCGDPFGATVIQTGSMSSTQTRPRYQNRTCML